MLPMSDCSLLVRTDFTSDKAWHQVSDTAQAEYEDGFRAYVEPVSDPAFDGATWQAVKAAVPATGHGALVLFIADSTAIVRPDHPVLAVNLSGRGSRQPFRCIPAELWSVENNLNIANMDWEDFAAAVGEDGVFRGFHK